MKKLLITIIALFSFAPALAYADITSSLSGHWNLDEGSGTTAADSSGNNHHGTLND